MKKQLLIYVLSLITLAPLWATTGDGEKKKEKTTTPSDAVESKAVAPPAAALTRSFPSLEIESLGIAPEVETSGLFDEGWMPAEDEGEITDSVRQLIAEGKELIAKVREAGNWVKRLDNQSLFELPVGIGKVVDGLNFDIVIKSVTLKPTHAELAVFLTFDVPQNGQTLVFYSPSIKFTKEGGIVGDGSLELLTDYAMNFDGGKAQLILRGTGTSDIGTYVKFDCDGFREMGLDASVKFSRDMLRPEQEDGRILEGNVESSFKTVVRSWNDLVVQVDMPPFQVVGLDGVGFSVRDAVFDFSDIQNAPAVQFPEGYQSPAVLSGTPELWRGFYLRELSVRLPDQFEKKGTSGRTSFAAYDVLIDDQGVSGLFKGENLIQTNEGDMSGWSFSLDELYVELQANQLREAWFNGGLVIPLADEERPFEYTALINPGNEYLFNVSAAEDMQFDLFKTSSLEIYEASYIEVRVVEDKFRPKASLHGRMDINAKMSESGSSQNASLANITFENLELQTVKPYIRVGDFSFGSEAAQQAMAKFPVSINNIGLRTIKDNEVGLDFDLIVNLNSSFGGEAGLTIVGDLKDQGEGQRWKFKKVQVNDISVDIDQGAFKFYGRLQFFRDDDVYGNGFNGVLDATFKPGVNVQATAIFGNVRGHRFWYADALAKFPKAIPVVPPFGINGFGGGAFYGMKMDNEGIGSDFGKTASGVVYVPDEKSGLGLKATIAFATVGSESVINGDATFEIAFFKGGGVRSITFTGNIFLVTPPIGGDMLAKMQEKTGKMMEVAKKYENSMVGGLLPADAGTVSEIHGQIGGAAGKRGSMSGHIKIEYNFEEKSLHANAELYVNVVGGIIKGVGPGGRAGWVVLHYDPNDWYFYLGTPDDRIGLSAGVGPIRAELTSYFMVGTKIPGSPPPPPEVSDILGADDLDYMRDENALGEGKGFGFGAALKVDTGDLTFLIFYARFKAGLGFDIMLKNYGEVRCKGQSDPLGINGWYANGQAYAFFEGSVGIRVKIFGRRKSIEILSIGAAVLLQAKLPNPFWMRGIVGGRFRVLGGLIKGNCKFQVTIGKECEIVGGSVLQGVEVISEVTPGAGQRDISVFNTPQAIFNMPIGKNFVLEDVDGKKKTFRIKLDEYVVSYDGYAVPGDMEWNGEKDVLAFNSFDVFPSETEMDVSVRVSFEEKQSGSWVPVFINGKKYVESFESTFNTGKAPTNIPEHNIEYSYPIPNQANFYSNEYPSGYIKLKKGQPELFKEDAEWVRKGRFVSNSSADGLFDLNYSTGSKEVTFDFPANVQNDRVYTFDLVSLPAGSQGAIDRNVSDVTNKIKSDGVDTDTEIKTRAAEGSIDELQESIIYSTHIRTSKWTTLSDKLNAADMSQQWRWPIRNGVHELGKAFLASEFFDNSELNGTAYSLPLIQFEAVLDGNKYYDQYMYPIIYDGYPLSSNITIGWRNPTEMGVPPIRNSIFLRQHPFTNLELSETDISTGQYTPPVVSAAFIYNLPHYYEKDYLDLQRKAANQYSNSGTTNARITKLLTSPFPRVLGGPYKIKIKYVLPGKNIVASEKVITLTNPVE